MKIHSAGLRAVAGGADLSMPDPADENLLEISFSSEEPYARHAFDGGYIEVLGHGADDVDLSRLNSGAAPLLTDHYPSVKAQAGVVVRAWLDGGKGRALVRFAKTPDAQDLLAKVRDGIVTCVSVGYRITQADRVGTDPDGLPILRMKWQPHEISFVSIPADPTVGLGRDAGETAPDIVVSDPAQERDDPTMTTPLPAAAAAPAAPQIDAEKIRAAALREGVGAIREIDAYAARFGLPAAMVAEAKRQIGTGDKPVADVLDGFRERAMDHVETTATEAGHRATAIGMRSEEVRQFSLFKAVRYLQAPHDATRAKEAGFELECSRAFADKVGKEPGGVFIPNEVLMDSGFARAQSTLTASAGGALVPTTHAGGSFIDMLREKMILPRLGARIMTGLVGDIDIPKRTAGATLYWVAEDTDVTDSEGTFAAITMSPHTAGMAVPITRRLMQNGVPDVEALVRDDILNGIAIGTDKMALIGDADVDAPNGLRDYILAAKATWAGGAGSNPTFADVVGLETAVANSLALGGNLAYVYGPSVSGLLKTTPRFSGGEIPIEQDGMVNGYRREVATQMSGLAREIIFGNFEDLIVGYWSGFDLRVDKATRAKSDGTVLRVFVDMDVQVRHAESFKMGNS